MSYKRAQVVVINPIKGLETIEVAEDIREGITAVQIHSFIGGFFEVVSLPSFPNILMCVDDEGRLKNLWYNPIASALAQQPIVGNAFLCRVTKNGSCRGLKPNQVKAILKRVSEGLSKS